MLLQGKTAVISGAASRRGIGLATAKTFAAHGARVAILDLDLNAAHEAASSLGEGHIGLRCDVNDPDACKSAVASVVESFGQVDILINNAGFSSHPTFARTTPESWQHEVNGNLNGYYYCAHAVLDNMKGFGLRITEDQRARILDYLGSYMGPNPPPTDGSSETVTAAEVSGKDVFNNTCIACHMEDGKGKPGEFPPLAGNTDLFLSPEFPALVVLNGIEGPLSVEGHDFNNVMPSFDFLSDSEIAAVLTYVRSNWGNDTLPGASTDHLTSDDIKAIRSNPMTSVAVHEARAKLLK